MEKGITHTGNEIKRNRVLKGYKFRIYPNEKQKEFFIQTFGCVRFVYNHLLMMKLEKKTDGAEKHITPAGLKKDYPFLKQTDSLALANAQRNLERAFTNYFNGRAGYPKLKTKKSSWQSYTTNNQKHTVYLSDNYLKLPKLKSLIEVHKHRAIVGEIKSATISAYNNQEFYVSILCVEDITPLPKTNATVGIVYCPEHLFHLSKATVLSSDSATMIRGQLPKEEKILQRRAHVAKRRRVRLIHAKNYQKQKLRVFQLREKQKSQKRAYIDQATITLLVQYDQLFIEARPVFQEGRFVETDWQQFLSRLRYKSEWYGKTISLIDTKGKVLTSSQIEEMGLLQTP